MGITEPTVTHHGFVGGATPTDCTSGKNAALCPKSTARLSTGIYTSCTHTSSGTTAPTSGSSDCVVTNLLDNYQVTHGVSKTATTIKAGDGLSAIKTAVIGDTHTTAALSIHDFNLFRKLVAEAINTLDKKIESILAITAPSC